MGWREEDGEAREKGWNARASLKVLIKKLFLFALQCTEQKKKLDKTDEVDKSSLLCSLKVSTVSQPRLSIKKTLTWRVNEESAPFKRVNTFSMLFWLFSFDYLLFAQFPWPLCNALESRLSSVALTGLLFAQHKLVNRFFRLSFLAWPWHGERFARTGN